MLAGLLAINIGRLTAPLPTLLLFGWFTLPTAQAWWRGLGIDCGCFNLQFLSTGLLEPFLNQLASPAGTTLRNFLLLLAAITLCSRKNAVER